MNPVQEQEWILLLRAAEAPAGSAVDRAELLDRAVALGADVAPGVVGCSVTTDDPGAGWMTRHFSRPLAMALDEAQYASATGPCVEAATTGHAQHLPDLRAQRRLQRFGLTAAAHGVRSSLSVPLPRTVQRSALNLYADAPGAFKPTPRRAGRRAAGPAGGRLVRYRRHDAAGRRGAGCHRAATWCRGA